MLRTRNICLFIKPFPFFYFFVLFISLFCVLGLISKWKIMKTKKSLEKRFASISIFKQSCVTSHMPYAFEPYPKCYCINSWFNIISRYKCADCSHHKFICETFVSSNFNMQDFNLYTRLQNHYSVLNKNV